MKYFIFYVTFHEGFTKEYYIKGKSIDFMLERIERYSDGYLSTSKFGLLTHNVQSIYVREIEINHFPYLSKKDFAVINETKSYHHKDFM